MGRAPCCDKLGLKKGPWTPEEDQKLIAYIQQHGHGSWRALPKNAGLLRCGKSCRLRWTNYLRPDIKRGRFSLEEEQLIIQRHAILGNRWSAISTHLPGRTDNEIKNYWNTHLKKRLLQMGIDPVTHKPKMDLFDSFEAKPVLSSTLSHMAQWENARLEAEARLAREYLKLASCRQPCGNGMIQMADGGRAWKGELWESIRKDFSSTASMDQYSNCSSTDFRKVLRDWEQSLQGHALNFSDIVKEDRFSTQDLSFSLGNDTISLPFDVSHTALLSESLGLKGVPKLEQNLSPSCCSLDSMDDHCRTDNSLQCESLLQQTEKLLQNKALLSKEIISADAIQNPVEKSHETSLAAAISEPSAFSEVSAINAAEDFWPEDKITKERVVNASCPSPALAYTNHLLSQETNHSISFAGNSSYTSGLQLPAELLLDLASLQQQAKSATCAAAVSDQVDLSSFSDQAVSMQSKDYWCNVLKLVGSPVLG